MHILWFTDQKIYTYTVSRVSKDTSKTLFKKLNRKEKESTHIEQIGQSGGIKKKGILEKDVDV